MITLTETDRFLTINDVLSITSLKRSTLYAQISKGIFPKPYKIGARRSAWKASEISAKIASYKH